jgi:hypothetical protein
MITPAVRRNREVQQGKLAFGSALKIAIQNTVCFT